MTQNPKETKYAKLARLRQLLFRASPSEKQEIKSRILVRLSQKRNSKSGQKPKDTSTEKDDPTQDIRKN